VKKLCNKGFTLIELLVSFAILGVVSITLVGLITSSMEYFRRVNSNVNLQYEYQIVMTQIREYAINCNGAIHFDSTNNVLYILNVDETGNLTGHIFDFDGTDTLSYEERGFGTPASPAADWGDTDATDRPSGILSSNISNFAPGFTAGSTRLIAAMTFVNNDRGRPRTYTGQQTIALRNAPFIGTLDVPGLPEGEAQASLSVFLENIVNSK
jgi:prepilin-type N-terminal cleavage/methylation domain-containing protein